MALVFNHFGWFRVTMILNDFLLSINYSIFGLSNKTLFKMKLLEGKVAIITGASRGIGSGIAKTFAQHGANVAFTYSSSAESAQVLENELSAMGIKAKGYKSNAADFNEAQKLVDDVMADFGNVDILINNNRQWSFYGFNRFSGNNRINQQQQQSKYAKETQKSQ
jgi:NADPH:quinone reductase-like Zn-dependent oxidoreductase